MADRRTGPPRVKLGHQAPNGIAAGLLALVERGAARRPRVARELRGRVELASAVRPRLWVGFGSPPTSGAVASWITSGSDPSITRSDFQRRPLPSSTSMSRRGGCASRAAPCWRAG
jgi:hypothetical protein